MAKTYIQAIGEGFPNVQCHAPGEGDVYETIVWDSGFPLPAKETLDEWILSNDVTSSNKKITVLAFRKRFTLSEKVTLEIASIDNPGSPLEIRQMAATLRVIMKDMESATFIDLDDPSVISGLVLMENFNLIADGRSDEILNKPILETERPVVN
jgi:hypothetical protein